MEALRREHEASIDPLEVMERLLPKLEGRVELRLQDPEAFATRVALGGERGHATLAARTKDIVKRGPRQKEARTMRKEANSKPSTYMKTAPIAFA